MVSIHHQKTHRCRLYRSPRSNPARPPPGRSDLCVPHREAQSVGLDPDRREPCPDALAILPGEDPGSGQVSEGTRSIRKLITGTPLLDAVSYTHLRAHETRHDLV